MRMGYVGLMGLLVVLPACARDHDTCRLTPMSIHGSTAKAEGVTVTFGEPDDTRHPAAWQGPLQISSAGTPQVCTVSDEVSIVENPVLIGQRVLYVSTYSGSTDRVYAVDVASCRIL